MIIERTVMGGKFANLYENSSQNEQLKQDVLLAKSKINTSS